MDRPNPSLFRDQEPIPLLHDESAETARDEVPAEDGYASQAQPAGGYAQMPASAPSPAAGATTPMPDGPPAAYQPETGQPVTGQAVTGQAVTGQAVTGEPVMATPATVRRFDPWNYRDEASLGDGADVVGFGVEAIDGHIGKIDRSSTLVGDSYLVVDTGPWIFGKRVLLPAGTVKHVDSLDEKVYVDLAKAQIKDSPEFDPDEFSPEYRDKIGGYYHSTYGDAPSTGSPSVDSPSAGSMGNDHSTYGDARRAE